MLEAHKACAYLVGWESRRQFQRVDVDDQGGSRRALPRGLNRPAASMLRLTFGG